VNDAAEYLAYVASLILANTQVEDWEIVREEAQGAIGLFRYRLTLQSGDMLEMFERFAVRHYQVNVTKYSFHWQKPDGQLVMRWDNAAHHPEISTYPHHRHDNNESNVLPGPAVSASDILALIG